MRSRPQRAGWTLDVLTLPPPALLALVVLPPPPPPPLLFPALLLLSVTVPALAAASPTERCSTPVRSWALSASVIGAMGEAGVASVTPALLAFMAPAAALPPPWMLTRPSRLMLLTCDP